MIKTGHQTRRVAVTMNKGGSGKTTTAVHLAAGLAKEGKQVLLIDADPQSDAGNVAGHLGIETNKSLYDFIVRGDRTAIVKARENLYIIGGGYGLNELREKISGQMAREFVLQRAVGSIEEAFDFIIIDTPPSWDVLNLNALFYADEIILPINLEGMTVNNLRSYLETNLYEVEINRQHLKIAPLRLSFALPTRFDRRTKQSAEILAQVRQFFTETVPHDERLRIYRTAVLSEPIRYNVRISEAAAHGETVFEFEPQAPGAADYARFAASVAGGSR